jgi:hypothetical protein
MYKIHLFQYKSQFNTVFKVNPGNQGSPKFLSVETEFLEVIYMVFIL